MNPDAPVFTSIEDLEHFGTLRAILPFSPATLEIDGKLVTFDQCWLENHAKMHFLYSPFCDTDRLSICLRADAVFEDPWPYFVENDEIKVNLCMRRDAPDQRMHVYIIPVGKSDLPAKIILACDKARPGLSLPVVTIDLDGLKPTDATHCWLRHLLYWPLAFTVYVYLVIPILMMQFALALGQIKSAPNPHGMLTTIQRWLYKISPYNRRWK